MASLQSYIIVAYIEIKTKLIPQLEQELFTTFPEHMSSQSVFCWVRVTQYLAFSAVCYK